MDIQSREHVSSLSSGQISISPNIVSRTTTIIGTTISPGGGIDETFMKTMAED